MILRSKVFKASASQTLNDALNHNNSNTEDTNCSKYFSTKNLSSKSNTDQCQNATENQSSISHKMLDISDNMNRRLKESMNLINQPPIKYIYNPTEYALEPYQMYLTKYCENLKKILFVGMNPGPFGMCQTGVPFGDPYRVKNWLKITANVGKPPIECPSRPIQGFQSQRKEVSGDRLWKLCEDLCVTAEIFFRNSFVYNYCPLAFMDASGRNLTPADIKNSNELESICDEHYLNIIDLLQPNYIVAIGTYIEKRTLAVLKGRPKESHKILRMPHPSPRAPNNQNWNEKAKLFLENNNLLQVLNS